METVLDQLYSTGNNISAWFQSWFDPKPRPKIEDLLKDYHEKYSNNVPGRNIPTPDSISRTDSESTIRDWRPLTPKVSRPASPISPISPIAPTSHVSPDLSPISDKTPQIWIRDGNNPLNNWD